MSTTFVPIHAPVRTLMLTVTEDCNLRCTYCYVIKKPRAMSLETARKAVDFFLDRNISGADYWLDLNFFGGEPFMALDCMEEVVRYARLPRANTYKAVRFSATTNGTVASPRAERLIREARMGLLVSLDGTAHADRHRPFTSGRASYEHVAHNLPKLIAWSPDLAVRATYGPNTLDLVGSARHLLELGAPSIALCPVLEADWSRHAEAVDEAHQALADEYVARARAGAVLPLEVTNRMLQALHASRRGGSRPARPCSIGSSLLGVDPDGNVMPCHRALYRRHDWLGTVDDTALSEKRWAYAHLSSRDILGCGTCPAEPVCGGGCRVAVLERGGSLYDTHPSHCLITRAHARAVTRIYDTLTAENNPAFARALVTPRILQGALAELATR